MAKVETKSKVVSYVLELSEDEAETLRDVLGYVGGSESTSRRKFTQAVFDALVQAGVEGNPNDTPEGTMFFQYNTKVAPGTW